MLEAPTEAVAKQMLDAKAKATADADKPLRVNLKQLQEEQRVIVGVHEAFDASVA